MAIQMRRGALADYDDTKMLAGELGVTTNNDTDDQKAFVSFAPGVSKEVLFVEDAGTVIASKTSFYISNGRMYLRYEQ